MIGDPLAGQHVIDWLPSKFYVGEIAALSECDIPGKAFQHIIEGYLSLNAGLKEFLGSLEPEEVEKYLRDHLLWKVGKVREVLFARVFRLDLARIELLFV